MNPLRSHFLIRDGVTYLNHGSFGACPIPVFEAYQKYQRLLEEQPCEFLDRDFASMMADARTALADYVGADPNELVFVPNATTGINIAAQSIDLVEGDEILTTDLEYGALDRAWQKVCRHRGCRYVRRPITLPIETEEQLVQEIWGGVTNRTRVLYLSHITSSTALTMPVATLAALGRARGLLVVVDGAHAPGQIPLDLSSLDVDVYTGNCHKWMMAPKGCAFLYVRKETQDQIEPLVVSWGDKSAPDVQFVQELEWVGTRDISAYLSLTAAIDYMREQRWDDVRARCRQLVRSYRRSMQEIVGTAPLCPDDPRWFCQMSAHPLPPCDGRALQQTLYDRFRIEIPVSEAGSRQFLRISVQGYNTAEDVEYLTDGVAEVLPALIAAKASTS